LPDLYHHLGSYVGKVLHGARPADLPIERPVKFELVVNIKAAKALQVTIPATLLANADDLIE
jgi:putative ABC transport system substrate-binding protein